MDGRDGWGVKVSGQLGGEEYKREKMSLGCNQGCATELASARGWCGWLGPHKDKGVRAWRGGTAHRMDDGGDLGGK